MNIIVELESDGDVANQLHFNNHLNINIQKNPQQQSANSSPQKINQKNELKNEILIQGNDNETKNRIIREDNTNLLSKMNILGMAYFKRFWQKRAYFFSIDIKRGRILCYKKIDSKSHTTSVDIIKAFYFEDEQFPADPYVINIKTKKKRVKLVISQDKEVKVIRQHLDNCFRAKKQEMQVENKNCFKGFFITLGQGQVEINSQLYQVSTGLLIGEELNQNIDQISKTPNKVFEEDAQNRNKDYKRKITRQKTKNDNMIPVSGMFFGTNRLVSEILGVVGIIQSQLSNKIKQQQNINQPNILILHNSQTNINIQQPEIPCDAIIALVFKAQLATIDLIIMKMQGDEIIQKDLRMDFFKINIKPNKKQLSQQKYQKQLQIREQREKELGIDIGNMFVIKESEHEILYLNNNNGYIFQNDIQKIQNLSQVLKLDDIDATKKREDDYENDREIINGVLDYYEKMKSQQNPDLQDKSCEFMILYPKKSDQQVSEDEENEEYYESMNEFAGEDTIINYERVIERYENKFIPRQFVIENASQRNHYQGMIYYSPYKHSILTGDIYNSNHSYSLSADVSPRRTNFSTFNNADLGNNNKLNDSSSNNNNNNQLNEFNNNSSKIDNNNNKLQLINIHQENESEIQLKQNQSIATDMQDQEESKNALSRVEDSSNNNNNEIQEFKIKQNMEPIEESDSEIEKDDEDEEKQELNQEESIFNQEEDDGTQEWCKLNKKQLQDWVANFKHLEIKDEDRVPQSHKSGGKHNENKEQIDLIRGVGKEILSQIGRKILSGEFNLTQVSFPIKAMIPKSALQTILYSTVLFPYYISKACQINDKVERFKLLITAVLGNFPVANTFLKPLNPILGETFEAMYMDGTKLYSEQTSHHPPVSYFLVYGPEKSYIYSGYYLYETNAGWNSLTLKNNGKRKIQFKDGQVIKFNFGQELYSGTFMGTMKCESLGQINFIDEANNISATVIIGKVKKKPSDYVSGTIKVKDKIISNIYGSYLGFMEFDNVRYWDWRHVLPHKMGIANTQLESDHSKRKDRNLLLQRQLKLAQTAKEELEVLQRNDAKLRKQFLEQLKKNKSKKK